MAPAQNAVYMHVDDTAAIALGDSVEAARENANSLMEWSANALTEAGFRVTDRHAAEDKQRIVGYEIEDSPARLRAPAVISVQVRAALLFIAGQRRVCVNTLRALPGIWLWLVLLRRGLLGIPQSIFKLIDTCVDLVWIAKLFGGLRRGVRQLPWRGAC